MTCARYGVHMPNLGRGRTENLLFRKDVCDRTGRKKNVDNDSDCSRRFQCGESYPLLSTAKWATFCEEAMGDL